MVEGKSSFTPTKRERKSFSHVEGSSGGSILTRAAWVLAIYWRGQFYPVLGEGEAQKVSDPRFVAHLLIRPPLNKKLFPVHLPSGLKRADWNFILFFSQETIFFT